MRVGFETERKIQSVEFSLKASPSPSAGRVMLKFSGTVKAWRIQNSCVLAQTLTQSDILKCCESWKRDLEEFVLIWSSHSLNLTILDSTQVRGQLRRFDALVPLSWITHHIGPIWRRRVSFFFPKLEERQRGRHYCRRRTMKLEQLWFRHRNAHFYREWHTKLLEHWQKCVDRQGDYARKGFIQIFSPISV
jgi:hypothetical protein